MAPIANYADQPKQNIRLLVTGMGPYPDAPQVNPSSRIAKLLAGELLTDPSHPHLQVRLYTTTFLTSYQDVSSELPALHQSGFFDGFLHLGLYYGSPQISLERGAYRIGYEREDPYGQKAPEVRAAVPLP